MGAAGALVLALAYRRLTWAGFQRALLQSLADFEHGARARASPRTFSARCSRGWVRPTGSPTRCSRCQLPPTLMLALVTVLIFLLGWPFEWPAVILVFLPIFYPVVERARRSTWCGSARWSR